MRSSFHPGTAAHRPRGVEEDWSFRDCWKIRIDFRGVDFVVEQKQKKATMAEPPIEERNGTAIGQYPRVDFGQPRAGWILLCEGAAEAEMGNLW